MTENYSKALENSLLYIAEYIPYAISLLVKSLIPSVVVEGNKCKATIIDTALLKLSLLTD